MLSCLNSSAVCTGQGKLIGLLGLLDAVSYIRPIDVIQLLDNTLTLSHIIFKRMLQYPIRGSMERYVNKCYVCNCQQCNNAYVSSLPPLCHSSLSSPLLQLQPLSWTSSSWICQLYHSAYHGLAEKRRVSMCVGCGGQIQDQFILRVAPDLEWHAACLKCADCNQYLDETCTCFVRDGKTYCKRDYVRCV